MAFNMADLLNKKTKIAAEAEGEEKKENQKEIFYEDVEILDPSEDNFYSIEEIEELAAAIEVLGGIQQPVIVKEKIHGRRKVIAGHRRRAAVLYLIQQGKEQYRLVPCMEADSRTEAQDRLLLILTNSTARQLSDWEKVQQAKELDRAIKDTRKELEEEMQREFEVSKKENPELEGQEPPKLGKTRNMVAALMKTSATNIQRYEAIYKYLLPELDTEFKSGTINISTAYELAGKPKEEQQAAYKELKERGELHLKDVTPPPSFMNPLQEPETEDRQQKPGGPEEDLDEVAAEIVLILKKELNAGKVNFELFKNGVQEAEYIEKVLRRNYEKDFKGGKIEDETEGMFMYRFHPEGVLIVFDDGSTIKIGYKTLAEITEELIESGEVEKEPETPEGEQLHIEGVVPQPQEPEAEDRQQAAEEQEAAAGEERESGIPGQITFPHTVNFLRYITQTEGTKPEELIVREIAEELPENPELVQVIAAVISKWIEEKAEEFENYLAKER